MNSIMEHNALYPMPSHPLEIRRTMDGGGGDWRDHLPPGARSRTVSLIFESVKKNMPDLSEQQVLNEPQRIAVLMEEKAYSVATDPFDYFVKNYVKRLSMEVSDNIFREMLK